MAVNPPRVRQRPQGLGGAGGYLGGGGQQGRGVLEAGHPGPHCFPVRHRYCIVSSVGWLPSPQGLGGACGVLGPNCPHSPHHSTVDWKSAVAAVRQPAGSHSPASHLCLEYLVWGKLSNQTTISLMDYIFWAEIGGKMLSLTCLGPRWHINIGQKSTNYMTMHCG